MWYDEPLSLIKFFFNIARKFVDSVFKMANCIIERWGNFPAQYIAVRPRVLPIQATKALRAGRGIALPYLTPRHCRWGGGVSTTPRPLYPRERPGTHCTGGWVGPRAGLDGCGKSRTPTGIRSPDRPARSESLYRLSYPGRHFVPDRVLNVTDQCHRRR